MTMRANLLVELLVEELPPKALKRLGDSFASLLADSLRAQGLATTDAAVTSFATPRRLAVHISAVEPRAADKAVQHKLMPASVGLDAHGKPTPALLKKLASLGADESVLPQLTRKLDGKAEALFLESQVKGATLAEGLQRALAEMLAKLPIPKVMQYQLADGWSSVNFVRPAHGLVALHGTDVVAVTALGLTSGRATQGHRFEAVQPDIKLRHADSYAEQLRVEGAVIASYAERRADIVRQLAAAAAAEGLRVIDDEALVDEVTSLVEKPKVMLCRFDSAFLAVPPECLILTMKANQKYFPLLDADGRLTDRFLIVSNIDPADASRVIEGNQRVVRPRLADAKFFFDQDRKKPLESRVAALDKVVYHGKLGTQGERVARVRAIARDIGQALGGAALAAQADRAALLAKADLVTDMVGEFPELQGVMGGYYARHDGESEAVALAIEDHYKPRFAGDALPRGEAGIAVALADKLETLVGLFRAGERPSGDKDPYALRRHALGVLRMLMDAQLALSLGDALRFAERPFSGLDGDEFSALIDFVLDRLKNLLRERGASASEVNAVCAPLYEFNSRREPLPMLVDIPARLAAVHAFATLAEAPALASANKRVANILKKSSDNFNADVNPFMLHEPAEKALFDALESIGTRANDEFFDGQFERSLRTLAQLKEPVDRFFETVMVNADDIALRVNRMALLSRLHATMNRVADLSRLAS